MNVQVICEVGGQVFSMDGGLVSSVENGTTETRLAGAPECCEGIICFRDSWVPVIDMRRLFNIGDSNRPKLSQIVYMKCRQGIMGFRVDKVIEIGNVPEESIQTIPVIVSQGRTAYVKGVARHNDRLVIIADHNRFLSRDEVADINEALDSLRNQQNPDEQDGEIAGESTEAAEESTEAAEEQV